MNSPDTERASRIKSADALLTLVYQRLHALAGSYLKRERPDNMLEPGMLVHETYLRLIENPPAEWNGTGHFFAVAASAMRKVLIDHARRRRALKRGFGHVRVSLEVVTDEGTRELEFQELDVLLRRLEEIDERACRVVELKFFTGLTNEQVAQVLDVSRKTVVQDWARARQWLGRMLTGEEGALPHDNGRVPAPARRDVNGGARRPEIVTRRVLPEHIRAR
ncbi:MAG: sigma-70 family RNA polymerase sigma factor [Phycisphaeraceae bacterium]|nr:sigma-70 family RNA polymerase sigma factor [Phycisphaeraceae bacterium]MBX3408050.1 sigma-70 family RNA polymerase sigma factor [Phycisphaeraceae bacterium]